ncbi:MAG TPA: hypothetical protein VFK06_00840 [Candidatus Angelobacter sp.]|nr:hypothetical protein [Candidatus Angelobacter sp.]
MRVHLVFMIYLMTTMGTTQTTEDGRVVPRITSLPLEAGEVTVLHLAPGYTTSVRLPEEVRSVVLGNPAAFKAEHSEAERRLVFLKPITTEASESNAMITTRQGEEISLHLVSAGKGATAARVDFIVEYQRPRSVMVEPDRTGFLIAETHAAGAGLQSESRVLPPPKPDPVAEELKEQQEIPAPQWEGKELLAAVGESVRHDRQTILGFSVLNSSKRVIELLPPQIELTANPKGRGGSRIKAEPVAVAEYRVTTRRLAPGQRADGVVVFERPQFKESTERLQLQLAEAAQVDRPIVLPVPFSATRAGGVQ